MRNQVFVQEQHLLEAVHRKVIDEQQMQEVLAIARSMGQQQSMPDLTWLTFVQCAVLTGIIGVPAIACMVQLGNGRSADMIPFAILGTLALLGATKGALHFGLGKPVVGIASAGAAFWTGGLALSLLASFLYPDAFGHNYDYQNYDAHHEHQMLVMGGGTVAMVFAALAIGRYFRTPSTALVGSFGFAMSLGAVADYWFRSQHQSFSDQKGAGVMLLASICLIGAAFVTEKLQKNTRYDVAFWLHTAGLMPLGIAGMISIDKAAETTIFWAALAIGAIALGTKIDRKSYIVAGCCAVFGYLPFGAGEARMGDFAIGASLAFSTLLLSISVLVVRSIYVARAKDGMVDSDKSVWG